MTDTSTNGPDDELPIRPVWNRAQKRSFLKRYDTTMAPADCEACDAYLLDKGERLTNAIGETAIMAGILVKDAIQLFINAYHAAGHVDKVTKDVFRTMNNPNMN